jgi:hypothetical protein
LYLIARHIADLAIETGVGVFSKGGIAAAGVLAGVAQGSTCYGEGAILNACVVAGEAISLAARRGACGVPRAIALAG